MTNVDKYENLLNLCVSELQSCVNYLQLYSTDNHDDSKVLQDIAKQYCEIDISHQIARKAQDATDKHFDNQENDCTQDVEQTYKGYLFQQNSTNSYNDHWIWRKVCNANTAQQLTEDNQKEQLDEDTDLDSDDNRSIDDGIMLSQFAPPVDPISKRMITNPCKNRKCGHIYEYTTLMDFLKGFKDRKSKPRCPHIGCSNANMQSSYIIKDSALKEQIQNFLEEKNQKLGSTVTSINDSSKKITLD